MFEQLSRRELGKIALGGALGAATLDWSRFSFAQEQTRSGGVRPQSLGIKLCCRAPANPTDDDLLFFKQVGVERVYVHGTKEDNSVERLRSIRKRYADAGLIVDSINGVRDENLMTDIVLNRPGRDKAIDTYKRWVRTLGDAGFDFEPSAFTVTGAVASGKVEVRGSQTRDFDLNSSELTELLAIDGLSSSAGVYKGSANSILFGREYSRDEIWENYTYWIKQVAPVAEEVGVRIGFHPDDPPVPSLFGVPRILSNFDDCKKALKIANSPKVGMILCFGTWEEGSAAMGIDIPGAIRYFSSQKQIFNIHYRNVSSPLPHFHDTYVDNGYHDMYKPMKVLVEVKYDGVVQLDHFVPMVGGYRTYEAFALGYMRAMLQTAQRA